MSNVALIESTIRNIEGSIAVARQQLAQATAQGDTQRVSELNAFISELNQSLAQARSDLRNAQSAPTASSGQVVAEEQRARSDDASPRNPPPSVSVLAPTDRITPDLDVGTNAPIRTQQQTQSTPPANVGTTRSFAAVGDEDAQSVPFANQQGGASSSGDDNVGPSSLSTQQTINANFSQKITPKPNILDEYASYTYSITWYMLTPAQFNQMQLQQKKNCASWQLLMQSAGAPKAPGNGGPGRNSFFSNDYYIDNLEIETQLLGKGTAGPHNTTAIKFTVTEPNGFTLIENLYKSAVDLYKRNSLPALASWQQTQYCLVIRFYGYDANGTPVQVGRSGSSGSGNNMSDPRAVVEKFFPFTIAELNTQLINRAIEYEIIGAPTPYTTAMSSQRGTIPFNYELVGSTVGELLNGRTVGTTYTRPDDGRNSSPTPPASNPTAPVTPGNEIDINSPSSPFMVGA